MVQEIKITDINKRQELINNIFDLINKEEDLLLIEIYGILEHIKLSYYTKELEDCMNDE